MSERPNLDHVCQGEVEGLQADGKVIEGGANPQRLKLNIATRNHCEKFHLNINTYGLEKNTVLIYRKLLDQFVVTEKPDH